MKRLLFWGIFGLALIGKINAEEITIADLEKHMISKANIYGGQDFYYKGSLIFQTKPNVFGGKSTYSKGSLINQTRPNLSGGQTVISSKVPKKVENNTKPSYTKPKPYPNKIGYSSHIPVPSKYSKAYRDMYK